MGRKHQMISHPNGVKAVGLRLEGSFDAFLDRGMFSEVRQQQPEFQFTVLPVAESVALAIDVTRLEDAVLFALRAVRRGHALGKAQQA